jgi:hypothetical protein
MEQSYGSRCGISYSASRRRITQSVANAIADNGSEGIFRISDNEECMLVSNPFQINLGGGVGSSVVARLPGSNTDECWQSAVTLAETVQEVSQGYDLSDEDASYPSSDNSSFTSVSDSDDDLDIEKPAINVQLAQWAIHNRISHSALGSLLSILKPYHAELPCDPRTLLKTPQTYDIKDMSGAQGQVGQYSHFGISSGLIDLLQQHILFNSCHLALQFNFDGLPLFKSSSMELWPILCLVRQVSPDPFVVGLYCGAKKPSSVSDYLHDFVNELSILLVEGILCDNVHYGVEISCFVCDAPARSFIKNVKSHTGYNGCDKCTQEGVYVRNRMTFPETNAPLRTDDDFQNMVDEGHHHGCTPLSVLPVGLVTHFVFDYMHLVCLGVTRKLLKFWLCGPVRCDVNVASRLPAVSIQLLSERLVKLRSFIPLEFARRPRSVSEVDRWKATEFRQLLLYTGPVVLPEILSESVFTHFMLLSVGIRLLVSPEFCEKYSDYAHSLLLLFVDGAKHLYCEEFIVYNVHGLVHLAGDAKQHGSLDSFSSFPFENKLKEIKQLLRKPGYPLAQIIRRVGEKRAAFRVNRSATASKDGALTKLEHFAGPVPTGYEKADQFIQLTTKNYTLHIKKAADCCILIRNVGPALVKNILLLSGDVYIVYVRCKQAVNLFEYPLPSSGLGMYKVYGFVTSLSVCSVNDILTKCVLFPLSHVQTVKKAQSPYAVIPIVHMVID